VALGDYPREENERVQPAVYCSERFSRIKRKFGGALRSRTKTAQFNEVLCKVLAHNLCVVIQSMYELGISPDFGAMRAA
jgi:hypothetical protein